VQLVARRTLDVVAQLTNGDADNLDAVAGHRIVIHG